MHEIYFLSLKATLKRQLSFSQKLQCSDCICRRTISLPSDSLIKAHTDAVTQLLFHISVCRQCFCRFHTKAEIFLLHKHTMCSLKILNKKKANMNHLVTERLGKITLVLCISLDMYFHKKSPMIFKVHSHIHHMARFW